MIDHEKRIGKPYQAKPSPSAAERAARSEKLKAYNKASGNALTQRMNRRTNRQRRK